MTSPFEQFREWVTGGLGVGDPALSDAEIEAYTDAIIESIAQTYTDDDLAIPANAEFRANGAELPSIQDLLFYLSDSTLLVPQAGGGWLRSPVLHVLKVYDSVNDQITYSVYVGY